MRIAIDARELAGRPTGIGRYLSEILREWGAMPELAAHELVFCTPAEMCYDGPLRATVARAPGSGTGWEQRSLPRLARAAGADVLFCPAYSGPVFDSTPLVVAIHDVSFAAHPEWFHWREGLRRRLMTRAAAKRASRVLTLTEFSKREIVEHLGVPADRIQVIHPGVANPFAGDHRCSGDREALVLYVGSIFNRRHVPETIKGFERLARRRQDTQLVIVGDNRSFPRIDLEQAVEERTRVAIRPYLPDDELGDLYRRARAFVFLSAYEGFGLTPLEALSAGVPIVVLDTPVAREVYGAAAIYVSEPDPLRVEAALEQALFDDAVRARVLAAAPAIVSRYTWGNCARQVLTVLHTVVGT